MASFPLDASHSFFEWSGSGRWVVGMSGMRWRKCEAKARDQLLEILDALAHWPFHSPSDLNQHRPI